MEGLEKILNQIKENNIVCPNPGPWSEFYKKIGGFEKKGNDYDKDKYFPLILNGWGPSSKEDKHERFINSVNYFYEKHPNKRDYIESFFEKNNDWYKWDD